VIERLAEAAKKDPDPFFAASQDNELIAKRATLP
jgi:hypothetical protein